MTIVLLSDAVGDTGNYSIDTQVVIGLSFPVGDSPVDNVYSYLMLGWSPDLNQFVQWISEVSPNYNPTATQPTCNVANLVDKTAWLKY